MEIPTISAEIASAINIQREEVARNMQATGTPDAKLQQTYGVCAADSNRMPSGVLAFAEHGIAHAKNEAEHSLTVVRATLVKPRTSTGWTGLMHQPDGVTLYREGVTRLHKEDTLVAAEVMDESDFAIAGTLLTMAWIGARNIDDTGPRYLLRPTTRDRDNNVHPIPTFVKSGQDGDLEGTMNALETLLSPKPEARTRWTTNGLENITTLANPYVGVILAGSKVRPNGPLNDILANEIVSARKQLDARFGKNHIPIHVDFSHRHAAWEGGGEEGQLRIARATGELILAGLPIDGIMAETYVRSGKQQAGGKIPGLSWTDACIGQEKALDMQSRMDKAWGNRPLKDRQSTQVRYNRS